MRDGTNWYAYVGSKPTTATDPAGLSAFWDCFNGCTGQWTGGAPGFIIGCGLFAAGTGAQAAAEAAAAGAGGAAAGAGGGGGFWGTVSSGISSIASYIGAYTVGVGTGCAASCGIPPNSWIGQYASGQGVY